MATTEKRVQFTALPDRDGSANATGESSVRSSLGRSAGSQDALNSAVMDALASGGAPVGAHDEARVRASDGAGGAFSFVEDGVLTALDEETLAAEQARLDRHAEEVARVKEMVRKRQATQDARRAAQLQRDMEEAEERIAAAGEARKELAREVAALKKAKIARERDESTANSELAQAELETQAELLALHRVRLEEIANERERMERELRRSRYTLESINELRNNETALFAGTMKQLLRKADTLADELAAQQADDSRLAAYAKELAADPDDRDGFRVIDDVLVQRAAARSRKARSSVEETKRLNAERAALLDKRKALVKSRAEHEALMSKGLEFLVEMEMGNAPPREFILSNMDIGVDDFGGAASTGDAAAALRPGSRLSQRRAHDPDVDEDVEDTLRSIVDRMDSDLERLLKLKAEHKALVSSTVQWEYSGEWSINTVPPESRPLYRALGPLVDSIIDNALDRVRDVDNIPDLEELRVAQAEWLAEQETLLARLESEHVGKMARVLLNGLVKEVVHDLALDLWKEMVAVDGLADALSTGIVVSVLTDTYGSNELRPMIVESFREIRVNKARNRAHVFGHRLRTRPAAYTPPPDGWDDGELGEDDAEDDAVFADPSVPVLRPEAVAPIPVQAQYVDREQVYWSFVDILPANFDVARGGVTFAQFSATGGHLAVALSTGRVLVLNMVDGASPFILRSSAGAVASNVLHMEWSMDGSRLLVLDAKLTVRVFSTLPMAGQSRGSVATKGGEFVVQPLCTVTELRRSQFGVKGMTVLDGQDAASSSGKSGKGGKSSKGGKGGRGRQLEPAAVAWHPRMTLLATQPTFMVALAGGDILAVSSAVCQSAITHPILAPSRMLPLNDDLRVELFKGHAASVVGMVFPRVGPHMLSIDAKGMLLTWDYEDARLTGFGWFSPTDRMRIDITESSWGPAQDGPPPVLHFATEYALQHDVSLRAAEIDRTLMHESLPKALLELGSLDLADEPWHSVEDASGLAHHVYRPRELVGATGVFHTLSFTADGALVAHRSQVFNVTRTYGKVLDIKLTPAGNQAVIMVHRPPKLPKPGSIMIVVYDAETRGLVGPTIVEPLFEELVHGCVEVTRVMDTLGSDFVYALINNAVHIYSLASGFAVKDPVQVFPKNDMRQLTSVSLAPNHALVALACPTVSTLLALHVEDKNGSEDAATLRRLAPRHRHELARPESRFRSVQWTFSAGPRMPPTTAANAERIIRSWIEDMIAAAVSGHSQ